MKCPICKNECDINDKECSICGFTELNAEFLNQEEAAEWERTVLKLCRSLWDAHKNMYDKLLKDYKNLDERYTKLQNQHFQLGKIYCDLKSEYEELQENYHDLSREAYEQSKEIEELKDKVDKKQSDIIKKALGANSIIFEDSNLIVRYIKMEHIYYINSGDTRIATFAFENKSSHKLKICLKDITVDGFLNQEKTPYGEYGYYNLDGNKKGIENFNLIYENKLPGNIKDFDSVEFILYYQTEEGVSNNKQISLKL